MSHLGNFHIFIVAKWKSFLMTIAEKDLVFQESVQTQTNIIHFYLKEKSAQFSCVPYPFFFSLT